MVIPRSKLTNVASYVVLFTLLCEGGLKSVPATANQNGETLWWIFTRIILFVMAAPAIKKDANKARELPNNKFDSYRFSWNGSLIKRTPNKLRKIAKISKFPTDSFRKKWPKKAHQIGIVICIQEHVLTGMYLIAIQEIIAERKPRIPLKIIRDLYYFGKSKTETPYHLP